MVNYILLAASIGLAAAGQVLMKHGMSIVGTFPVKELFNKLFVMLFNPFVFIGISLFGISAVIWLVVLSRFELSFVYPMVSIAYILVAIASYFFLGEKITFIRCLGILTICLGVFFISRS